MCFLYHKLHVYMYITGQLATCTGVEQHLIIAHPTNPGCDKETRLQCCLCHLILHVYHYIHVCERVVHIPLYFVFEMQCTCMPFSKSSTFHVHRM